MFGHDRRSGAADAFGFAPKEAGGTNQSFQSRRLRIRVVFRGAIFREERWRDEVDPFVSALGG